MESVQHKRIPIGAVVRAKDAKPGSVRGKVIRHLRPSVGAPWMVKVQWPAGRATHNERLLEVVN